MSKGVCHLERYHRGDTARIRRHNEQRESHSNPDIDKSRSHLNEYAKVVSETWNEFADSRVREFDEARERLGIRKMRHDKNAVLAVGCILSASNDFFEGLPLEDQRKFLRECVAAMTDFVGEENVMSVAYHFDETTPHAHFMFVPVIREDKHSSVLNTNVQVQALSATRMLTKASLVEIQNMMFAKVFQKWGLEDREHGSQARHLSVPDFKRYRDEIRKIQQEIVRLRSDVGTSETELAAKQAELNEAKKNLRAAKKKAKQAEGEIAYLQIGNSSIRREKDELTKSRDSLSKEIAGLKSDIAGLKSDIENLTSEKGDLETETKSLKTDLANLTTRRNNLATEVEAERTKLLADLSAEVDAEKKRQVDEAVESEKEKLSKARLRLEAKANDEAIAKAEGIIAAADAIKKNAEADRKDVDNFVREVGMALGLETKTLSSPLALKKMRQSEYVRVVIEREKARVQDAKQRKEDDKKQRQIIEAAKTEREKQNRIFEATAAASMQEPPSPTA